MRARARGNACAAVLQSSAATAAAALLRLRGTAGGREKGCCRQQSAAHRLVTRLHSNECDKITEIRFKTKLEVLSLLFITHHCIDDDTQQSLPGQPAPVRVTCMSLCRLPPAVVTRVRTRAHIRKSSLVINPAHALAPAPTALPLLLHMLLQLFTNAPIQVQGWGLGVWVLGFGFWGLGFGVKGLGFGVLGALVTLSRPPLQLLVRGQILKNVVYATHHPSPFTLHPSPFTLHPSPFTLHPSPFTLHPSPFTPHPSPQRTRGQSHWRGTLLCHCHVRNCRSCNAALLH